MGGPWKGLVRALCAIRSQARSGPQAPSAEPWGKPATSKSRALEKRPTPRTVRLAGSLGWCSGFGQAGKS
eukprot:15452945-Alexandrium_andersonii.AAC.1